MKSVAEVVLLKSGELTSERGIPSGELISSREENGLRDFPYECLRELLTTRATCPDQILTTTQRPALFHPSRCSLNTNYRENFRK